MYINICTIACSLHSAAIAPCTYTNGKSAHEPMMMALYNIVYYIIIQYFILYRNPIGKSLGNAAQ